MKNVLLMAAAWCIGLPLSAQILATTEEGKKVWLYDNGTWRSAEELSVMTAPYAMPTPPFKGKVLQTPATPSVPKLVQVNTKKNEVTDTEEWFRKNNLSLPVYEVPNALMRTTGNIPDKTPRSYNEQALVKAIYSDEYHFLIYGNNFGEGNYLLIADKQLDSIQHVLDFSKYVLSPAYKKTDLDYINQAIQWAAIDNNILYVSHAHRTYAASSNNMNAYITAIDLSNYKVLWRTVPLVCNTLNFVVHNNMIISGYGFTAEPDFLYTINKQTGVVAQKLLLKSGPEYIIKKGKKVYVRTYDTDYEFQWQ